MFTLFVKHVDRLLFTSFPIRVHSLSRGRQSLEKKKKSLIDDGWSWTQMSKIRFIWKPDQIHLKTRSNLSENQIRFLSDTRSNLSANGEGSRTQIQPKFNPSSTQTSTSNFKPIWELFYFFYSPLFEIRRLEDDHLFIFFSNRTLKKF